MSNKPKTAERPHLVHEARAMLLQIAARYCSDPELNWDDVPVMKRHAVNAALDLEAKDSELAALRRELEHNERLLDTASAMRLDHEKLMGTT